MIAVMMDTNGENSKSQSLDGQQQQQQPNKVEEALQDHSHETETSPVQSVSNNPAAALTECSTEEKEAYPVQQQPQPPLNNRFDQEAPQAAASGGDSPAKSPPGGAPGTPVENNGATRRQSPESQLPALVQVKQEPPDDIRDCYTPNHAVSAVLAEAMTLKFSMPRHRYVGVKPAASPDPAVCEVCQAEFPTPQLLQPHKLCHFNTCHVCYVCDTYFTHADTMTLHMATIHRSLNPTGQAVNDDGREWFVCPVCLQRFSTGSGLSKHQTAHVATESSFGCRVCGLDFVGSRALMAHLGSSRHNEMKVKMQGVFVCVDCRSIFASRDAYAMHMMLRAQNETCTATQETKPTPAAAAPPAAMGPATAKMATEAMLPQEASPHEVMAAAAAAAVVTSAPTVSTSPSSSSKPPSRSSSVLASSRNNSPLNLTTAITTTPASSPTTAAQQQQQQHAGFAKPAYTCAKCLATFGSQEALAVHLVMHSAMEKGQELRLAGGWAAARPNSAPVGVMHPNKSHSPWMCGRCLLAFDTCDSLAMHMMTKHANESDSDYRAAANLPQSTTPPANNNNGTIATSGRGQQSPGLPSVGTSSVRNGELMAKLVGLHNNGHYGGGGGGSGSKRGRQSVSGQQPLKYSEPVLKRCRSSGSSDTTTASTSWFECPACKQMFNARIDWYKHVLACGQPLEQQRQEQLHTNLDGRSSVEALSESRGSGECSACGMVLPDVRALSAHYRTHHQKERLLLSEQLTCHFCTWTAADAQTFALHMEEHDVERTDAAVTSSGRRPPQVHTPNNDRTSDADGDGGGGDPKDDGGGGNNGIGDDRIAGEAGAGLVKSAVGETAAGAERHREPLNLVCADRQDLVDDDADFGAKAFAAASSEPSSAALQQLIDRCDTERAGTPKALPGSTTSGTSGVGSSAEDGSSEGDIIDYVLTHAKDLAMCKYCKIVYTDKTLYCLHMGLHNLNNPWQCNMCGKACHDIHEFTSHVIHF